MKRIVSLVLVLLMAVSLLPFSAFAEGEEAAAPEAIEVAIEEKKEEPAQEEKPAEEPKAEPVEEPAQEEKPVEEPVEEPAEQPIAEEPAEEPIAEEPAEEPVTEEPAEEPIAEEPAEEPVTEEPAEEPVTEQPVEEPVAEETVEEPIVETLPEEEAAPVSISVAELKDAAVAESKAEFTVAAEASDGSALSYQWQQLDGTAEYQDDAEREAAWTDIENETGAALLIEDITAENFAEYAKYMYRCVITCGEAKAVTAEAKLIADPVWETDGEKELESLTSGKPQYKASGKLNSKIKWTLTEEGVLRVSGSGNTPNYDAGTSPFYEWAGDIKTVETEKSVTGIGAYLFYGCYGIGEIDLIGVRTIGSHAFAECTGLDSIGSAAKVTEIGAGAFENCASITSVAGMDKLKIIGGEAFCGCTGLSSVTLSKSVSEMGSDVFKDTQIMTAGPIGSDCDLEFGWTTEIPNHAFSGCESLISVTLPYKLQTVSKGMFKNCTGLNEIKIPDTVSVIGASAFAGCTNLKCVGLPGVLKGIGASAFEDCAALDDIELTGALQSVGTNAFNGCDALSTVTYYKDKKMTSLGTLDQFRETKINSGNEPLLNAELIRQVNLDAPDPLEITNSGNYLSISWGSVSGAVTYQLYRSYAKKGTYACVYGGSSTEATHAAPPDGGVYYFKVRAVGRDDSGKTVYGDFTEVEFYEGDVPEVSDFTATASGAIVKLKWTSVPTAAGYEIFRARKDASGMYTEDGEYECVKRVKGAKTVSTTDSGRPTGRAQYYKIRAYWSVNDEEHYSELSEAVKVIIPLNATRLKGKKLTPVSVYLDWEAVPAPTDMKVAQGYEVYQYIDGEYQYIGEAEMQEKHPEYPCTHYTVEDLDPNGVYKFMVLAYCEADGEKVYGKPSNVMSFTLSFKGATPSVSKDKHGDLSVKWSAVSGATYYELYCSTEKDDPGELIYTGDTKSFTFLSPEKGMTYYFRTRAICVGGATVAESEYSSVKSFKVK